MYFDCCVKKIECFNDLGNVIEIVNKGLYSYEFFWKNSFLLREIRVVLVILFMEDNIVVFIGLVLFILIKENVCQSLVIVEGKRNCENEVVEELELK